MTTRPSESDFEASTMERLKRLSGEIEVYATKKTAEAPA
jgi:hypothetical protein